MTALDLPTPRWALPLMRPARYKGAHGGRGSGKSHAFAEMMIEAHVLDPNRSSVCVREVQRTLSQSVKRLLEDKIQALGVGEYFEVQESVIKSRRGTGRIIFAGMQNHTADSIKSLEGYDCAWVEEAQSLSQKSLDLLRPTIRKPESELWFTWNPDKRTDPIELLLRGEQPPPGAIVVEVNYNDNPWFPDVLRAEMEYDRLRDLDKYNHVWKGLYRTQSQARVFKNWRVEDFEAPADAQHRLGADWGFAVDPSVLVRCHVVGRTLYVDYEAYMVGCDTEDLPTLFMGVPGSERWTIVADGSRPETLSHMTKKGFKIVPAVKGARSVEEGVEFLRGFDIVVHPRCRHTIDELDRYSYKVSKDTGEILPLLADKHNHCIAEGEMVLCERGYVPIEEVTTSDRVLTRGGWRPVLFADVTDVDRDIVRVTTTIGSFLCTPDHEVWTSKGFVRADALRYDDEVIGDTQWASLTTSRQLNGAERHGADTQAAIIHQTGSISLVGPQTDPSGCIAPSGLTLMDRFRAVITSITSTRTRATTRLRTFVASLLKSTLTSILGVKSVERNRPPCSTAFDRLQGLGTPAMKASPFIDVSAVSPMPTLPQHPSRANAAAPSSCLVLSATVIDSAPTSARQPPDGPAGSMTSSACALAALHSPSTDTASNRLAPGRVVRVQEAGRCERVYDLTVEEHHEFIVGGVLVSNCIDALRYACEGARRLAKVERKTPLSIPSATGWR